MPHRQRREHGVTLIELLVTVSIAAILLTIAVPSFQTFLQRNRVQSAASDLVAALNLARSEAIRQGRRVSVCGSANPAATSPTCGTNQWGRGFVVFADADGDGEFDADEDEVLRTGVFPTGLSVTTGNHLRQSITYTASGRPHAFNNDTIRFCAGNFRRDVIINTAGRVRVQDADTCPSL